MTSKVHLAFFLLFACCVTVPPLKIICKVKQPKRSLVYLRDEMRSVDEYFNRSLIIFSSSSISHNSSFLLFLPAAF